MWLILTQNQKILQKTLLVFGKLVNTAVRLVTHALGGKCVGCDDSHLGLVEVSEHLGKVVIAFCHSTGASLRFQKSLSPESTYQNHTSPLDGATESDSLRKNACFSILNQFQN